MTTPAMTRAGIILGTAAYMSPEQAKGKAIDARSDIWAFGCVLFEMLSGHAPFKGESVVDTLGEVLKSAPDWSTLPPLPASIDRLLRRCLVKDPALRLQHIGDARLEIDDAFSTAAAPPLRSTGTRWQMIAAAATVVAMLAVIVAGYGLQTRTPAIAAPIQRFTLPAPEGTDGVWFATISPSGRQIAILAPIGRTVGLFVRPIGSVDARLIAKTTAAATTFWSPNEQFLGYFDGGVLKVIDVATGETRILCDAPAPLGGTWGQDDTILFAPNGASGIARVSARGGPVTQITTPDRDEESHRFPQFLPDGRHFVFLGWTSKWTTGNAKFNIRFAALDSPASTVVAQASSAAWPDPAGYLLFATNSPPRLAALKFDASSGTAIGDPVTIVDDLQYDWVTGQPPAASGPGGMLLYVNRRQFENTPTWFDRSGHEQAAIAERGVYFDPAISPDERSVLLERADPNTAVGDVVRIDLATGAIASVVRNPGFENVPIWSPDGRRVIYSWDRDGVSQLFLINADGSGEPAKLYGEAGSLAYAMAWSRDDRTLLFTSIGESRVPRLWVLSLGAKPEARRLFAANGAEREGSLSRDGRWLAYSSNESGQWDVYVCAWPSLAQRHRVSSRGGMQPQWRGDGKELFYLSKDGVMAATVSEIGGDVQFGTPTMLFAPNVDPFDSLRNRFSVTSDGQRFLVLKPVVDRRRGPITAVLNWTQLMEPR
jgi:Tol biopolymer transport system component